MAANDNQGADAGARATWTVNDKYNLLLRIVDIYQTTHGKFDNARLNTQYPNRTPKAMTHQWGRILDEIKKLNDEGDFVLPGSATKKAPGSARKRTVKAPGDDEEGEMTPKPTPARKRIVVVDAMNNDEDGTPVKKRSRKPKVQGQVDKPLPIPKGEQVTDATDTI